MLEPIPRHLWGPHVPGPSGDKVDIHGWLKVYPVPEVLKEQPGVPLMIPKLSICDDATKYWPDTWMLLWKRRQNTNDISNPNSKSLFPFFPVVLGYVKSTLTLRQRIGEHVYERGVDPPVL